jgi:ribosome-binding factor A
MIKDDRLVHALQKAASDFVNRESNRQSMITVTRVAMDERGSLADVYISVFPDTELQHATEFLNRNRDEFKMFLKKHVSLRTIPRVRFLAEPNIGIESTQEA